MNSLLSLHQVYRANTLLSRQEKTSELSLESVRGRLTEISGQHSQAAITLAVELIAQCHRAGEPAAWIGPPTSLFYPPDAAGWSLDWSALALLQIEEAHSAGRAADKLLRSGAFGLVVLDLFHQPTLPTPLLGRLLRLAETHESALLFLTPSAQTSPSLSSLIALRVEARWKEAGPDRLQGEFRVLKDKRHGPGQCLQRSYHGPLGLR